MNHLFKYLILAALITLGSSCVSPFLSKADVEEAVPLQEWEGINNLYQDDLFFFGGQPDSAAFDKLTKEASVRTVISFRRPQEMEQLDFDEPALMEKLRVRFVNIPVMPDTFSEEDVNLLAGVLAETKEPVLLHCSSSNRAGGIWAAYLVLHRDYTLEDAMRLGKAAGLKSDSMIEAVRRVVGEAAERSSLL